MSNVDEIRAKVEAKGLADIVELIDDAKDGYLTELELVEALGLVHDPVLNEEVIELLKQLGVQIIYVTDEEE